MLRLRFGALLMLLTLGLLPGVASAEERPAALLPAARISSSTVWPAGRGATVVAAGSRERSLVRATPRARRQGLGPEARRPGRPPVVAAGRRRERR